VTGVAGRWCSTAPKQPKNAAAKRATHHDGAWLEFRAIAALHDCHWHLLKPQGFGVSEFLARTPGFGPDAGYVYSGARAPWDDSLGTEYRAFSADEMELEQDCEQILDDDTPVSIPTEERQLTEIQS